MGNTSTRLAAAKQRALAECLEEMRVGLTPHQLRRIKIELMGRLHDRGYEVRMLGGDRVWDKDEPTPTAEEIRAWRDAAIDRQNQQASLLLAYRDEVRDMRLAVVVLLETWDALMAEVQVGHEYLPKNTRRILDAQIEMLREEFGYDVVREDRDGAPLPDQPRDWRAGVEG